MTEEVNEDHTQVEDILHHTEKDLNVRRWHQEQLNRSCPLVEKCRSTSWMVIAEVEGKDKV